MAVDFLGPTMAALLDCTTTALQAHERPVGRAFLNPGLDVPWDNCCEGEGQTWVRVIEQYPSGSPFPARDTTPNCGPAAWAVTLGAGVLRCTPTVDDNGTPPTPQAMTDSAIQMTEDAAVLEEAIRCCFPTAAGFVLKWVMGQWQPLGPQGGCAGGEWTVTIAHQTCACP